MTNPPVEKGVPQGPDARGDDAVEATTRNRRVASKSSMTDTSTATTASHPQPKPRLRPRPWYREVNPLRWGGVPEVPDGRAVSREYKAGFLSKLTFQWMTPLMTTGYKRQLEQSDIWTVNPDRAVEPLADKVREAFQRHLRSGQKHPLLWALHDSFRSDIWLGGLCSLLSTLPQVLSPFVLRFLIQFAADAYVANAAGRPPPPIGHGIGLVVGITLLQLIQIICVSHFIYRGMMIGGQSRAVLIGLIYEKAMVLSNRARAGGQREMLGPEADGQDEKAAKDKTGARETRQKDGVGWSNGRIVNLMSVDTYRIDQASALAHIVWAGPFGCLITLAMLLVNLTYSALAGFALLVLGMPALTRAIRSLLRRRKAINKITDQRVSLTQEILQSVRLVKYFGWEMAFLDRLGKLRSREMHAIQILLAIRNAISAISMSLPIFASILSFITYSLSHHALQPAHIFSSLALFNSLRNPLNLIPVVLGQVIDAWSSLKRIEEFLMEEEKEEEAIFKPDADSAIELRDASFTWERTSPQDHPEKPATDAGKKVVTAKTSKSPEAPRAGSAGDDARHTLIEGREPFKLRNINLKVGRNELIAVIGTVASGKSSLLASLAGDMRRTGGDVVFGASRAFCPQYAWIQNTTLQNNITFGKAMDRRWYDEIIKACALEPDLDMLPNGDQTEIGERGINISGGQKQRLNIARAIYFDADIVLMDDPLSAVDAHVGRHILDNAILGLLGDKCRILATHQLWVLSRCDRIVWMEDGRVQAVDTFEKLMRAHEGFRALMQTTAVEEKRPGQPDEDEDDAAVDGGKANDGRTKAASKDKGATLMQAEEKARSSVPWSVYGAYVGASGSLLNAPLAALMLILSQGANVLTGLWLSFWVSDKFGLSTGQYMGIYAGLGALQAMLMFLFSLALSVLGTRASKAMLGDAVARVLRAPISFFDTTPLGRITNRFSRDVDVMDNNLTDAMRMFFITLGMICAAFLLTISFFYYFVVALGPLYVLFILAAAYYRASAREVKRFESVLRSHVFAKFSEGLGGVASIRAYGLRGRFLGELRAAIDDMNSAYYLTFANQRWLSMRLDLIGAGLVFTVGILAVTSRFSVDPSISGLVLSYIMATVQLLQFAIRQLAEVENGMNAVERLRYYGAEIDQEAPAHTMAVRQSWPERGEIVFDRVEMRYRDGLPLVLQGLSMHIGGGERVGIVGRTGAGKSSIMSTLFRIVEISGGSITIDGLDISTMGLQDLRSRLAIIPQDPILFHGTVRSNLDPFHEHTDLALWSALRQAGLVGADAASSADDGTADASRLHLESGVDENGLNFSLGQRQLMALARALLRGSQIIVCDEATSSVDMETDDKIQETMATAFRGKTLLCIAHRLRTIVGYDRICVMDAGRIVELDSPLALWHRGGVFRAMCDRSGIRVDDIQRARDGIVALEAAAADSSGGR